VNVRSNGDGTYSAEYVPKTGSRHTVQVNICSSLCSFIVTSDADIEQIFSFKCRLVL
jgi:hypothetical protein